MEKLDALIHNEIERKAEVVRARNSMMMVIARVVTFVLKAVAIILKLTNLLRYIHVYMYMYMWSLYTCAQYACTWKYVCIAH